MIDPGVVLLVSGASKNTSCSFHFAFICMHLPRFSFHVHSSSFNVVFISLHFPFMFIPMCIHVLSFSFHLHACSFHFAFMSFHLLSEVMEMVLLLGQGTECNKWLSLNNLSKSPPTYDIVRQIFFHENDRQRDRERERKKRARKRERERASELDAE